MVSRKVLSIAAVVVVIGAGLVWLAVAYLRPQAPAGGAINLQEWKLTLPVAGKKGDADTVEPAAITEPWLTQGADGGLTFWAPAAGATTKNSEHPRTELDNLTNFSAGTSGPRTLKVSLAVSQVPADTKDIIIGQIHGADVALLVTTGRPTAKARQLAQRCGIALVDRNTLAAWAPRTHTADALAMSSDGKTRPRSISYPFKGR